jgi:hypothetical protein
MRIPGNLNLWVMSFLHFQVFHTYLTSLLVHCMREDTWIIVSAPITTDGARCLSASDTLRSQSPLLRQSRVEADRSNHQQSPDWTGTVAQWLPTSPLTMMVVLDVHSEGRKAGISLS